MTIGYPDYIRESKQAGTLLESGTLTVAGEIGTPIIYVGNYQYLIITIDASNTTDHIGCTIVYSTAPNGGSDMGASLGAVNSTLIDSVVSRVRGPFVGFGFYNWETNTNQLINYYIYGTNMAPVASIGATGLGQWAYYNNVIGASATATISPIPWHSGTALLTGLANTASSFVMSVDQYQYQVGWQNYINLEASSVVNRSVIQEVPIPPTPIRIRLVNQESSSLPVVFLASPKTMVAA